MTDEPEDKDRPKKPPRSVTQEVVEHGQKPDPRTTFRGDR